MSSLADLRSDTATDRVVRAVVSALEAYREELDDDEFLSAVNLQVRLYHPADDPRRGLTTGDVRNVVVQRQSEFRPG